MTNLEKMISECVAISGVKKVYLEPNGRFHIEYESESAREMQDIQKDIQIVSAKFIGKSTHEEFTISPGG